MYARCEKYHGRYDARSIEAAQRFRASGEALINDKYTGVKIEDESRESSRTLSSRNHAMTVTLNVGAALL